MSSDLIVRVAVGGAALHAVATVVALTVDGAAPAFVAVSLALGALGLAAFARTMVRVAGRSRTEELSVGGIWFLTDAPAPVKRTLLAVLAVEVVVAIVGASIRPYTALAFGVFAPLHGLGMAGLWSAERGTFPARRR